MKIRTKINVNGKDSYVTYDIHSFEEFFDFLKNFVLNTKSRDFNGMKLYKWDSEIIKNRIFNYYESNKLQTVNLRKIAEGCKSQETSRWIPSYYTDRGWSYENALKVISEEQTSLAKRSMKKMTNDRLPTQWGYWLKKRIFRRRIKK